jgi:RNA polymerase sigma-70 factor (ECF subfamily)
MNDEPADERALAALAAAGDRSALEALYERYADPLFAFVFHQLDGARRADVEDAWQETWLAAVRALPRFRGTSAFFSWLCAIARHKIADQRRRGRRRDASQPPAEDAADVFVLADPAALPDALLQQRDVRLSVVEALASLPRDYRVALVARYVDNRSIDEVGAQLGRGYKATESLLSRARAGLRDAIGARSAAGAQP